MARSEIKTWLPLDRWAEIIGIHPLHFNGLDASDLAPNTVCGSVWFQHSWQHSDRVGIEDVSMAIQAAEQEIAAEVGFNLLADWTVAERIPFARPGIPGVYNLSGTNPRGELNSIELRRGHVISGGVKTKAVISAGAAIVRTDEDGDGYSETCTVTVATTITEHNEIACYYAGKNGEDAWEIRPITVSFSGGNVVIQFKSWQVTVTDEMDAFDPDPLDAEVADSYETTIDVYRLYNDPSTQVQFMWENTPYLNCSCGLSTCTTCQLSTQAGCFHLREPRIGIAVPTPGSWDSNDEGFDAAEWGVRRAPDQARFWYYSGYEDRNLTRSKVEMAKYWEYAVAFFAASKLDRSVCGCSNVQTFIDSWRMDVAVNEFQGTTVTVLPELLSNRLGTTRGAIYAWKRIQQTGMRVSK